MKTCLKCGNVLASHWDECGCGSKEFIKRESIAGDIFVGVFLGMFFSGLLLYIIDKIYLSLIPG